MRRLGNPLLIYITCHLDTGLLFFVLFVPTDLARHGAFKVAPVECVYNFHALPTLEPLPVALVTPQLVA